MKRSRDYTEKEEGKKQILTYINHVKAIFCPENSDKYNEFLRFVVHLKNQETNFEEIKCRLKELLHGHADLIMGFNAIMPERYRIVIDEELRKKRKKGGSYRDQVVDFLNDLKVLSNNNGGNPNLYMGFLNVMRDHHEKGMPIEEVNIRVRVLLQNHTDLFHKFISFQSESGKEITERVPDPKIGFFDRLLSPKGENPSYVKNHKTSPACNKSELAGQVINQSWNISKKVGKGSGEKADLRTKEDDFYKMDMSVKIVQSTMMRVQDLVEKIKENHSLEVGIKNLKDANLRCIQDMYGDRGAIIKDFLKDKTTAAKALPIILSRMEQKLKKSGEIRSNFTGTEWDVFEADYSDYLMWNVLLQENVVVM